MAGHVTVPIYASLGTQSVRALLDHCEPVCCFLGAVDDERIVADGIPSNMKRISFPSGDDPSAETWESVVATTPPLAGSPVRDANDLATIIYTSGTTGIPKGAMHRFAAFVYFVRAQTRAVGDLTNERFISYLPLAHIAERALVEAIAVYSGLHIFFVEKIDTFLTDLKRARPTIFFSVPRLYIKLQQGVLAKLPQQKLDRLLRIPGVSRFIRWRILRKLGFDRIRIATSGGAPLAPATLEWYRKLGLNLVEGYGMTETGITHTPRAGRSRPGYVGDGIEGSETRIAETGEVLIKSPMSMLGYYKDPEATRLAFTQDGFFRTGDLGELDAEGWLKITGRVKEQFKTSKGKYVSPAHIERLLATYVGIEGCCVMGAGMVSAFALIQVSPTLRDGFSDPEARESFERSLSALREKVNCQLDPHEQLRFLVIVDEPWSIENGLLTPTMKLKRTLLENRYSSCFESWVRQDKPIVWHTPSASEAI
jgi:long-chain acyl-CoA synthetase